MENIFLEKKYKDELY